MNSAQFPGSGREWNHKVGAVLSQRLAFFVCLWCSFGAEVTMVSATVPVVANVSIQVNKKTIDAIANLLTERFMPRQSGITHAISFLGRQAPPRCLDGLIGGRRLGHYGTGIERNEPEQRRKTGGRILGRYCLVGCEDLL
jgi:hypothetical protein